MERPTINFLLPNTFASEKAILSIYDQCHHLCFFLPSNSHIQTIPISLMHILLHSPIWNIVILFFFDLLIKLSINHPFSSYYPKTSLQSKPTFLWTMMTLVVFISSFSTYFSTHSSLALTKTANPIVFFLLKTLQCLSTAHRIKIQILKMA